MLHVQVLLGIFVGSNSQNEIPATDSPRPQHTSWKRPDPDASTKFRGTLSPSSTTDTSRSAGNA